jgi:hypothetical protein
MFSLSNGEIKSAKVSKDEPVWSVNFKKALALQFQTRMDVASLQWNQQQQQQRENNQRDQVCPKRFPTKKTAWQGDQIRLIFVYCAIFFFGQLFENTEAAQVLRYFIPRKKFCINFGKRWCGLHFGRVFHKLIWLPRINMYKRRYIFIFLKYTQ